MNYLELLGLSREPFSNSPDPDAFYNAPEHGLCLNLLEIAVQLRRGLNVVYGEVGTGKSTLCRCLLRSLSAQERVACFCLLDAGNGDALAFIAQLYETFSGRPFPAGADRREGVALLQSVVCEKALEGQNNLVLLIDEGQKLAPDTLEVLRELLNFETNTEKLLQIVIFAQPELEAVIDRMPNLKDRINEVLRLGPMSCKEGVAMMRFRLRLAGGQEAERLFTEGALVAIHDVSGGRPRQMMRLGHQMLLALIMGNRSKVTPKMVRAQAKRDIRGDAAPRGRHRVWLAGAGVLLALLVGAVGLVPSWRTGLEENARHGAHALSSWLDGLNKNSAPEPALPVVPAPNTQAPPAEASSLPPAEPEKSQEAPKTPEPVAPSGASASVPQETPAAAAPATVSVAGELPERSSPHLAIVEPPAASPLPPSTQLGVLRMEPKDTLESVAVRFYGATSAAVQLRRANPLYAKGEPYLLTLPVLRYRLLPKMRQEFLLCCGSYENPQQAFEDWRRHKALALRIVPRELAPGTLRFYLLSQQSFSTREQAEKWAEEKSWPEGMAVQLMPPYGETEPCYYNFSR